MGMTFTFPSPIFFRILVANPDSARSHLSFFFFFGGGWLSYCWVSIASIVDSSNPEALFTQDAEHLANRQRQIMEHIVSGQWECSHCLQATTKDLSAKLHANVLPRK